MAKSYKSYEYKFIGISDIAALTMVGTKEGKGIIPEILYFGEDGSYSAYVVPEEATIGSHYKKVATYNNWMRIYDDEGLAFRADGTVINVYRAGEFGCIIQIVD